MPIGEKIRRSFRRLAGGQADSALTEWQELPPELLEVSATELYRILPGPTLIHLRGHHPEPILLSVLLHGDETSGWEAARSLLREWMGRRLPRALSLFVGNVAAAREGRRRLEGQPDYNRLWGDNGAPGGELAREVRSAMAKRGVFAAADFHNRRGVSRHYVIVPRLTPHSLFLANLFSRTVVHLPGAQTTHAAAFSRLCPAVTLECGPPGQPLGITHAREFMQAVLHLRAVPSHPVPTSDYELYRTVATLRLLPEFSFAVGLGAGRASVTFKPDLEALNFNPLPAGTSLAAVRGKSMPVSLRSGEGEERAEEYLRVEDGELRTRRPLTLAMVSLAREVVRQEALAYLVEPQ